MRKSNLHNLLALAVLTLPLAACGGSESISGGADATGGVVGVAGTGGANSTGGDNATGGSTTSDTGGVSSTGGTRATGGAVPTGGRTAATGGSANGGATATGGSANGGAKATGGSANGGANSTGGSGGASVAQQDCDAYCAIVDSSTEVASCRISDCPTTCVKYNDALAAVSAGCSNALLGVLECGIAHPTGWACVTQSGITLPVPITSCITPMLTLSGQLNSNPECVTALQAAQNS
jgi:hypothetical protein